MSAPYTVSTEVQVRFRDSDAMGHVNNAVYASYLELGRMRYWTRATGETDFSRCGLILARLEIDYRSAAELDTPLTLWTRVSELRNSSFHMEYRLEETGTRRLIAEAKSVQVCYDYAARKVRRVPEELRRQIRALERPGSVLEKAAG